MSLLTRLSLLAVLFASVSCGTPPRQVVATEPVTAPVVETQVEGRPAALAIPHDSPGEEDVFETARLISSPQTDIVRGGRRELQVVVERRGFEVPLYFRCENLPSGVRLKGTPRISVEGDRILLSLVATLHAPLCSQVFRIVATAADGSIQGTRLVRLTVRN